MKGIAILVVTVLFLVSCRSNNEESLRKAFLRQCQQRRTPPLGGMRKLLYAEVENTELSCEKIASKLHPTCLKKADKEKRSITRVHSYVECMHQNKNLF